MDGNYIPGTGSYGAATLSGSPPPITTMDAGPAKPKTAGFWIFMIIIIIIVIGLIIFLIWHEFFRKKGSGGGCVSNTQCGKDLVCSKGQCINAVAIGGTCSSNLDCGGLPAGSSATPTVCCANPNGSTPTSSSTGVCATFSNSNANASGTSNVPILSNVTSGNSDSVSYCGTGTVLKTGGCTSVSDCQIGYNCVTNTGSNSSQFPKICEPIASLTLCSTDEQCASTRGNVAEPQYCASSAGRCLAGTGSLEGQFCASNHDCRIGHYCDPTNGLCNKEGSNLGANGVVSVVNSPSFTDMIFVYNYLPSTTSQRLYVGGNTVSVALPNNSVTNTTSALVPNTGSTDTIQFSYDSTRHTLTGKMGGSSTSYWVFINTDGSLGLTQTPPPAAPDLNTVNSQVDLNNHPRNAYTFYGWVMTRTNGTSNTTMFFTDFQGNRLMVSSAAVEQGSRAVGFYNPTTYTSTILSVGSNIVYFDYTTSSST